MSCRVCLSEEATELFYAPNIHGRHLWDKDDKFLIMRCSRCQAVYVGGLNINSGYYRKYYPEDYYEQDLGKGLLSNIMNRLSRASFKSKENSILRYLKPGSNEKLDILDMGCGKGDFLDSLDPRYFRKFGVEINPRGYNECLKKNICAYNQDIKQIDFKGQLFDCITLWHVIEHLEYPLETLKLAGRLLKKNGILVVATPNTDDLGFKLGRQLWFHLDAPRHLTLFGKNSLEFALRGSGLTRIGKAGTFYDYPLDLFWSLRKSFLRFFAYPLYPVFKLISPETMCFISRKN